MVKSEIRVAVTGAGPCVFRLPAFEAALEPDVCETAIMDIEAAAEGLNADPHATPDYRAHLIGVMARRAVVAANLAAGRKP